MNSNAKVAIGVGVVALVLAGAGIFWFLSGDAPDAVSLDAARESATTTSAVDDAPSDGAGQDAADGIEGTWVVDTASGEFDFEAATGTFAGFRVREELAGIGSTEAVGRTGEVSGSMTIEGTTVTEATFEIDMSSITTDDSRRDNRALGALDVTNFPTATFELTEPIELGAEAADGGEVAVTAMGELTVRGVTNPVEFALEAQLVDGTVVVVGSTEVEFSDFGVEVPTAPIVLSAEDRGVIELQLLLVRS